MYSKQSGCMSLIPSVPRQAMASGGEFQAAVRHEVNADGRALAVPVRASPGPKRVLDEHREPEVQVRQRRHRDQEPEHVVGGVPDLGVDVDEIPGGVVPDMEEAAVKVGIDGTRWGRVPLRELRLSLWPWSPRFDLLSDPKSPGSRARPAPRCRTC